MPFFRLLIALGVLISPSFAHSLITRPEAMSNETCQIGGTVNGTCSGPCVVLPTPPLANFYPGGPKGVAATYQRGQVVSMAYARNNHGPGGFNRFTIVPLRHRMNKAIHSRNAFWYSCWGATFRVATAAEQKKDKFGFSITGADGSAHTQPVGYYTSDVTIPTCIPDGKYILGMVWFGGTGAGIKTNDPTKLGNKGRFNDFWSCSYIAVKGGKPVTRTCEAKFTNDASRFSSSGCMSAVNKIGICNDDVCDGKLGDFQKPARFLRRAPIVLKRAMFE